jgi:SAM-dependent methyltransferase
MTGLDVGGGHGQTAPFLTKKGLAVTVTGSAPSCQKRLPSDMPFLIADHLALPFEDHSVDVVISFRLLPHCERWPELIRELCRISSKRVIVDYPAKQSVNFLADALFGLKKNVEKNTRPFTLFSHREIREAFSQHGYRVRRHPQFFWPMVLHRMLKNPKISRVIEAPPRCLGLTRLFGSPVVLEAWRI